MLTMLHGYLTLPGMSVRTSHKAKAPFHVAGTHIPYGEQADSTDAGMLNN